MIQINENQILGKVKAKVVHNIDPEKMGRVLVIIPELFGDQILPWAKPINNQGDLPDIGIDVWLEFERGDINKPIYSGEWATSIDGTTPLPKLSRGLPDETANNDMFDSDIGGQKGTDRMEIKGSETKFFDEPYSAFGAEYSKNKIRKYKCGHCEEWDETPGNERIHIYHRKGSFIEFKSDGSTIRKTRGRDHNIVEGNKIQHIQENEYKSIDLNSKYHIKKNRNLTIDNNYKKEIGGETNETYKQIVKREYIGKVESKYSGDKINDISGGKRNIIGGSKNQIIMEDKGDVISGKKSTVITNLNLEDDAESKTILIGNLYQKLIAGDKDLLILLGDITKNILIGNIKYNVKVGDITFKTAMGDVKVNTSMGNAEFSNSMGSVKINPMGNVDIKGLMINIDSTALLTLNGGVIPVNNLPACLFTGVPHGTNVKNLG